MTLRPVDLRSWSELGCELLRSDRPRSDVLVVRFTGTYRPGSLGNPDAAFMRAKVLEGMAGVDASGVVLDLRGLTYTWGNSLLGVFDAMDRFDDSDPGTPRRPIVVVGSDLCRDAFLSLVTPRGKKRPDWYFDDFEAGLDEAHRLVEVWLES